MESCSAIITWVGRTGRTTLPKRRRAVEEIGVVLGGLSTETDENLRWQQRPLRIGDDVRIKVIEAESVDRPRHRQKRNRTEELRQQKTYGSADGEEVRLEDRRRRVDQPNRRYPRINAAALTDPEGGIARPFATTSLCEFQLTNVSVAAISASILHLVTRL